MDQIIVTKCLMGAWFLLGGYFVVSVHGGGGASSAAMAMICGFMAARNMAGIV